MNDCLPPHWVSCRIYDGKVIVERKTVIKLLDCGTRVEHRHGFPITSLSICRAEADLANDLCPRGAHKWKLSGEQTHARYKFISISTWNVVRAPIRWDPNHLKFHSLVRTSFFIPRIKKAMENRKKIVFETGNINQDSSVMELLIMTRISCSLWLLYNFRICSGMFPIIH